MSSILIYQPKDSVIPLEFLKRCFDDNNDSVGFSYVFKDKKNKWNRIKTSKNFKSFDNFYKHYSLVKKSPRLIHFAQKIEELNNYCGPFNIDDDHVFIHSGTIWNNKNILEIKDQSQSVNLLKIIKRFWSPILFGDTVIEWMVEEALNFNNTMVIMNNLGEPQFFNKKRGFDLHGCWLSKIPQDKIVYPNQSRYNYNLPHNPQDDNVYGKKAVVCEKCSKKYYYTTLTVVNGIKMCVKCQTDHANKTLILNDMKHKTQNHPNSYLYPAIADVNFIDVMDFV
jgi:hypothetical protein